MSTRTHGGGLRRTIFAALHAFCLWRGAALVEGSARWRDRARWFEERAR